jgi:Ca-activated chloride channel family protein
MGRSIRRAAGFIAFSAIIAVFPLLFTCVPQPLTRPDAEKELDRLVKSVRWTESTTAPSAAVTEAQASVAEMLPDVDKKYPLVVDARVANAAIAEIVSSTEKSGSGTDGCLLEIAKAFNERGIRTTDGRIAQVTIRSIPSGTGYEYIAYRRYIPDGFTPSNHLWIQMVKAAGVPMEVVSEGLVDNTAGIVMKDVVFGKLEKKYGTVDVRSIIEAVVSGDLAMGYTNPFASSTGLNFLVTVLSTFAKGDEAEMLSPEVVSAFDAFQRGVPFTALTTIQMRDSVEKGGSLDAFVMEYQTYVNTAALKTGWRFIPFGYAHDNPLYASANASSSAREVLELFAEFVRQPLALGIAQRYGFDHDLGYDPPKVLPSGDTLVKAQKIWKERKNLGKTIAAVFLGDVSGSMEGVPLRSLKEALIKGSGFINARNSIGLVAFSTDVTRLLPIQPFDDGQRARFTASVSVMSAGGNTAMYDGIVVALQMLLEETKRDPNVKPMLFVLTDGQTNRGYDFTKVERTIAGLQIPVYTISYGDDIEELKKLSALNEAANLRAGPDDIAYQIGVLLNAEM